MYHSVMAFELWSLLQRPNGPGAIAAAQRLDAAGWDGMVIPDSQNIDGGDPFVSMTLAVRESARLSVSIGVANPVTRHPALLASALCAVDEIARGRVRMGIGRGDSALAYIGQGPASTSDLEHYVRLVRRYAAGGEVSFDDLAAYRTATARPLSEVGLKDAPTSSRLHWPKAGFPAPPVDVAASGPRTIAFASAESDGVLLAVGAEPERLAWAVDLARSYGAKRIVPIVNVVPHPEPSVALQLTRRLVAPFARFSVMDGKVRGQIGDATRADLQRLHAAYDMRDHGLSLSRTLDDDFVTRFAVTGTPESCRKRLEEITDLAIDGLVVVGASMTEDREEVRKSGQLFDSELLPAVRAAAASRDE